MPSRRSFVKSAVVLSAAPGLLARANAQETAPTQPKWLEAIAAQLKTELNLPAVWIGTCAEGNVDAAVAGVRKAGDPTPATLQDKLTVASVSKTMAGLWIASLVDKRLLSYETRMLDILPELAPDCLPEHRNITLGQLMTHTAGVIRNVSNVPENLRLEQYPAERMRQARHTVSTPAPPDSEGKELYSNNGVNLAGTMAERAAGEPYEIAAGRFFRERLGLKSWDVPAMSQPDDVSVPWPHRMENKKPVPLPPRTLNHFFVEPSGGAVCTIADVARLGLLATVPSESNPPLLKSGTWQTLLAHGTEAHTTLGSFLALGYDPAYFTHGGSLINTTTFMFVLPEWKMVGVIHTNAACPLISVRGKQLVQNALCVRRAELHPPPPCRIALIKAAPVDATWENEIVPKTSDDKLRIRVDFNVTAPKRTEFVQTLVTVGGPVAEGGTERVNNRLSGLLPGRYSQHFEFDTPKTKETKVAVIVDSLGTAGNRTPDAARAEWVLNLT